MKTPKRVVEPLAQIVQFGELVLRQRLGGEKVEGARVGIFQHRVQDRQVVAERLAGGRGRDHHGIASGMYGRRSLGLVRIKLLDAFRAIGCRSAPAAPIPAWAPLRLARRDMVHGGDEFAGMVARGEMFDDLPDASQRLRRGEQQAIAASKSLQ